MPLRQVVRGKLRRDPAPTTRDPGAEHRHTRPWAVEEAQRVRQQAGENQRDEHDRDCQVLRPVAGVAWGGRQTRSDDADHDCAHRQVLGAPGVLVQHPLREEHQHEQPSGERRLHDDQRREQQRDDLQRPA